MARRQQIHCDSERGSTLLVVLILMSALAAIAGGMSFMASTEKVLASNDVQEKKTFYLAEAAIEEAIQYLNTLGEPFLGTGINQDGPIALLTDAPRLGTGKVTVYIDPKDTNSGEATRFVQISARATHDNGRVSKALTMRVGQQNFSRYAYFSDLETRSNGGKIWFWSGDNLYGPVHTNEQFHIYGSPTFYSEVSSVAPDIDYYNGGPPADNPDFRQGIDLGVEPIPLPQDLTIIRAKAQSPDGLYLTGMTTAQIEIRYNATLGKSELIVRRDNGSPQTYQIPPNGTVFVNGQVEVQGELAGQLTIASGGDMRIMDDVFYHTDPRVDPSSRDILGLVSEKNVIVAATQANLDSGDETIMGAIMALGESFTVENFWQGAPRGKLKLYGGLIQKRRGPVGTFSGSRQVSGYDKAYDHDIRLMDTPPPAYPTTGVIERMTWREIDPATDISANTF